MKSRFIFLFLIGFGIMHSQNYSKAEIKDAIIQLESSVTDTIYFDLKTHEKLEKPKLQFWVNDNATGSDSVKDENFYDNESYSIFQNIYKKGKYSDFNKMSKNENPSIRTYGFWALVKNKKYRKAENILELEINREDSVLWNSAGCLLESVSTHELMTKLLERMKKYGS